MKHKKHFKYQQILPFALFAMQCFFLLSCGRPSSEPFSNAEVDTKAKGSQELIVFNYGDYIDERVLKLFEKETGINIKYEQYVTPEDMYTKFHSGAIPYDVICTSDYMVEKMIAAGEAAPLNTASMPNYVNIDPKYLTFCESFDPGNTYSVPYFWGTVGILYNKKMVGGPVSSWNILWDEAYSHQIIMENSMRDAFLVPLKLNGYSLNTTNKKELSLAQKALFRQKPLVMAYMVDESRDAMIAGDAALAVVYSGDATVAMDLDDNLAYCVPEEGSNIWFDSLMIPKNAAHKEEAKKFIDFLCREDIAKMNFEYIYYGTPNKAVYESLNANVQTDPVIFPSDEILSKCEVYQYLGPEMENTYNRLWKELKAY